MMFLFSCQKINLAGLVKDSKKVPFISVWRVGDPSYGDGSLSLTFPTNVFDPYEYDYIIDWGDGTAVEVSQDSTELTHVYSNAGDYNVKIIGKFQAMTTYLKVDKDKLIEVKQLGDVG